MKNSKKLIKASAVVLVLVLALISIAGCDSKREEGVIRIGYMPYYASVPLLVIEEKGLDEKFGFEMDLIQFPSGGPMSEALGAGEWDIGQIGAGGMVAVPNYDAKLIADVQYEMDGAWIMARPDSPLVAAGSNLVGYPDIIGSAETLRGLTMLGTVGNISHYMAIDYVSKIGLDISDVEFIHMETAQIYNAFVSGNGDIACIGSPTAGQKLLAEGYVRVGGLKQQGNSQQDAMLVSSDFYADNYEDCVKFMQAWYTATEMLNSDPVYEFEMTKKFYSENGRTDFTDEGVQQECDWNSYIDANNYKEKVVGKWMSGLIQSYVDNGSMDESVIDALNNNIKLNVVDDAVKAMGK